MVPMDIHIADFKDEAFLIERDWLNKYQVDISYSKKEITFRVQGRKFTVKLTKTKSKLHRSGRYITTSIPTYHRSFG